MAIPHFAIPFRVEYGKAATVEQDSIDEISQCVEVLVTTELGQRVEVPTYGVPSPLFAQINDGAASSWLGAIRQWEPRAAAVIGDQVLTNDALVRQFSVKVAKANV